MYAYVPIHGHGCRCRTCRHANSVTVWSAEAAADPNEEARREAGYRSALAAYRATADRGGSR